MGDASRVQLWLVFFVASSFCLATAGNALGQRPLDKQPARQQQVGSPEAEGLLTIERYLGTFGTGLFVMGLAALVGGAVIGRALWIIRQVFRGDNPWYKLGVVLLLVAGILVLVGGVAMGVEIAQLGRQGKSLARWLNEL